LVCACAEAQANRPRKTERYTHTRTLASIAAPLKKQPLAQSPPTLLFEFLVAACETTLL
jgi:hypothetical protein